jgi:hypothetical protein
MAIFSLLLRQFFCFFLSFAGENLFAGGAAGSGSTVWNSNHNDSIRIEPEIDKKLRKITASKAPFTTLMDNWMDKIGGSVASAQMYFDWMEEHGIPKNGVVVAGGNAAATQITVDNAALVLPRWVIRNTRTKEIMYVSDRNTSTNVLTIQRGYGTTSAAAIVAGDTLRYMGHVGQEGDSRVQTLMRGTMHGRLYCQEIKHAVGMSLWEKFSKKRGVDEYTRLDMQAVEFFRQMEEDMMVLGEPGVHLDPVTGLPAYTTAGLRYFCEKGCRADLNGRPTYDSVASAVNHIFKYGDDAVRYGAASGSVLDDITKWPEVRSKVRRMEQSDSLGFDISELRFRGGKTLRLVELSTLDQQGFDDEMLIFSLGDLQKRHFGPSGTTVEKDLQEPGSSRIEWQMRKIIGLDCKNRYALGMISGMKRR